MELVILVGVWALAFGHISLAGTTKMKGNQARAFGAALILVAAYGLPHLNGLLGGLLPKFLAGNEAIRAAYGLAIGALAIHITSFFMGTVYPKLRIPSVNVSIKQSKRAA
jgi:hypothetical protein